MNSEENKSILSLLVIRIRQHLVKSKISRKLVYIIVSIAATLWFLVRVLTKPSRALYPCMHGVAPILSGYMIWLLALSGSAIGLRKARHKIIENKYLTGALLIQMS